MIIKFIEQLQRYTNIENVTNQYTKQWEHFEITVSNLKKYLEIMVQIQPHVLLVGEAPGYNGCRITGIPFTAEKNLSIVYRQNMLFGYENGFMVRDQHKLQSENSASIVWNVLNELNYYPLMWNAFPFHPYQKGNTESNRKPTSSELSIGKIVLQDLLNMFEIKKIIGVGKVAENILNHLGFRGIGIRHPSMGGKKLFVEQMKKLHHDTI